MSGNRRRGRRRRERERAEQIEHGVTFEVAEMVRYIANGLRNRQPQRGKAKPARGMCTISGPRLARRTEQLSMS